MEKTKYPSPYIIRLFPVCLTVRVFCTDASGSERPDSKMAAAVDKNILGLLNGLAKRLYYDETEITDQFLREELFPDGTEDEFLALMKRYENIMKNMVSTDMDFNQLEAFLSSQTKKREGAITQEQAAACMKFWRSNKTKIHDVLVKKSCWSSKLKDLSWRIDVKSQARHVAEVNAPVAIVEMQIENPQKVRKAIYTC